MTKISVIIPVYNTEQYLPKCLNSVCKQTLKDIEIICINDCSTDNSPKVLKEYVKNDNRIRIIDFKKNKGAAIARNTGIKEAKGEYIGFVDSDDFIDLDFYEKLYTKALETNADIIKGAYKDAKTGEIDTTINIKIKENPQNFCSTYCSAIFRTSLLIDNDIFFPYLRDMEDPVFALSAAIKANKIEIVENLYINIVKREDSITSQIPNITQVKEKLEGLKIILNIVSNSNISSCSYCYIMCYWFATTFKDSLRNRNADVVELTHYELHKIFQQLKYKEKIKEVLNNIYPNLYSFFDKDYEPYFFDIQKIKKLIDENDVISFDIFDTLLLRPFINPTDVFSALSEIHQEPSFTLDRIISEKKARLIKTIKSKECEDMVAMGTSFK